MTDEQEVAAAAEPPKPALMDTQGWPTPEGWRAIGRALRAEMPADTFNAGRRGTFSFITARQVQDRLDQVVGPGNWSTYYSVHPDGSVECTLTIFGVSKSDVGYRNNPSAQPGDAQYEYEPLKAAYSDAFKRAAVHWGIGRFLYGEST